MRNFIIENGIISEKQWLIHNDIERTEVYEPFDMNQLTGLKMYDKYIIEKTTGFFFNENEVHDFSGTSYLWLNIEKQKVEDLISIEPIKCAYDTWIMNMETSIDNCNGFTYVNYIFTVFDNKTNKIIYVKTETNTDKFNDNVDSVYDYVNTFIDDNKENLDAMTILFILNQSFKNYGIEVELRDELRYEKNNVKIYFWQKYTEYNKYKIIKNNKTYFAFSDEDPFVTDNGDVLSIRKDDLCKFVEITVIDNSEKPIKFLMNFNTTVTMRNKFNKFKSSFGLYNDNTKKQMIEEWGKYVK